MSLIPNSWLSYRLYNALQSHVGVYAVSLLAFCKDAFCIIRLMAAAINLYKNGNKFCQNYIAIYKNLDAAQPNTLKTQGVNMVEN